jgi:plastocyanin
MQRHHVLFGLLIVGLAVSAFVGCSKDSSNPSATSYSSTPQQTPPNTIDMSGMAFSPVSMTITKGTTITWRNNDGLAHTSTSDTGVWDTGNIPAGSSKTTTFANAGTFAYHCAYHTMMTGTIIVQ